MAPHDADEARPTLPERLARAAAARLRLSRSRAKGWRFAAPAMFVLAGVLFVTSAVSSGGEDLRAGRIADLGGLAASETHDLEQLRARQAALTDEVDKLTERLGDSSVGSAKHEAKKLRGPAGLSPVSGPGITVTLDDAPEAAQSSPDTKVDDFVVHQQDIQAVVNALWDGGAEAITIQDQRVVSTTGIRCVGNSVILHDVPYVPPYRISAIGPTGDMLQSLDASPYIGFYLQAVAAYGLGWDVQTESDLRLPGYTGSTALRYAHAAEMPGGPADGD